MSDKIAKLIRRYWKRFPEEIGDLRKAYAFWRSLNAKQRGEVSAKMRRLLKAAS